MNSGKGNMILLTVMSIATLLVAVVGATFAYFGALMQGSEGSPTFEVTSGTLSTEYNGDANIINGNVGQGEVIGTKEITVTGVVTGSNNFKYEVLLDVTNNTYDDGELFYTIISTNESNNGTTIASVSEPIAIPTGANTISLGTGVFAGPTTVGLNHKYFVTITRNGETSQNSDKAINAKFYVSQVVSQSKK
ncbi:MAG: hypothetical protein J1F35_06855 [Erysipelotrichales bacterium]|nr:hypothetical protein [Erysipelotrichales bacterium]